MKTEYIKGSSFVRECALFAQVEDPFALPLSERERAEEIFGRVKESLDVLSKGSSKDLLTRLIALRPGSAVERLEYLSSVLNGLIDALAKYEDYRIRVYFGSLHFCVISSLLGHFGCNPLQIEEGEWSRPFPYKKLDEVPEWVDYVSSFYSFRFSAESFRMQLTLLRKILPHLEEQEKTRLVLLAASPLFIQPKQVIEMIPLILEEGPWYVPRGRVPRDGEDLNLEQCAGEDFCGALAREMQVSDAVRTEVNLCPTSLQDEHNISYTLSCAAELLRKASWAPEARLRSPLGYFAYSQELDQAIFTQFGVAVRNLHGAYLRLSRRCALASGPDSDLIKLKMPYIDLRLKRLQDQIAENNKHPLSCVKLRSFLRKVSAPSRAGEAPFPSEEAISKMAFSLVFVGIARKVDSTLSSQGCSKLLYGREGGTPAEPCIHPNVFKELLRAQSILSSLFPSTERKPKNIRAKKSLPKKAGRKKRAHKAKAKKKNILQSTTPSETANVERMERRETATPTVREEVFSLAQLSSEPICIKRHRRTYNRAEFADDRRSQVLHYLPSRLIQTLLCKENPLIAKYVQWVENDPQFDGNHSACATVLCHDRKESQLYIGKLSVGMTPDGLVYHVYLNPYADLLGGQVPLEQSIVHAPPADLQEAGEGFSPVGNCQMSYNSALDAIDVLDKKQGCLYRIFVQRAE